MKNILLAGFLLATFNGMAGAASFSYTETETVTTYEEINITIPANQKCGMRYSSCYQVRPCAKKSTAEPVRVKTHTEVIDYYQVYQPVTVYKSMGTQIERRVVPVKKNKCGA